MLTTPNATREAYGILIRNNENELVFRCASCDAEFVDGNILKVHCMEHKEITDLEIECIENILKYLLPNDLAAMSQTCKQYKVWAERFVSEECVHEPLKFFVMNPMRNDTKLQFKLENYALRFRKLFPFIELLLDFDPTVDRMVQLYEFVRDNCSKDLDHLTIIGLESGLRLDESVGIIADQLKNLKLLKTESVFNLEVLMERCKEIKVLVYEPKFITNPDNSLRGTYPKLDVLILSESSCHRIIGFADFLQENPQLKAVIYKLESNTNIQDILLTTIKLPFAAIKLTKENFPQFQYAFEQCCKRKNIRSLEVLLKKTWTTPLDEFILMQIFEKEYISGLHCNSFPRLTRIKEIAIQPNLKRFCVNIEEHITHAIQLSELMKRLPELIELRITSRLNVQIKDVLMPLISQINKLKNIYLDCAVIMNFTQIDATELNAARSNLDGAPKLYIHLGKQMTETNLKMPCVMDFITIQLEVGDDMHCPLCSYNHEKNLQFLKANDIYQF